MTMWCRYGPLGELAVVAHADSALGAVSRRQPLEPMSVPAVAVPKIAKPQ